MAKLKIYQDIISSEETTMNELWLGDPLGVSFQSVDEFIESIAPDDNVIDLLINCRGGDVQEGWAIYDKLRATGKEISATVEGNGSSMASVILLAAPKERRKAYAHATMTIHNPYLPAAIGELNAQALRELADDMERESTRILDLYVERTGTDREVLKGLMDASTQLTAEQAKEYGFISLIVEPASAKAGAKTNHMTFIEKLKALIASEGEGAPAANPVGMELSTNTGETLTVEREEGEPQVGDKASPDGEHKMPDGKTIVVEGGVITGIKAEDDTNDDDEEKEALRKENEDLKKENEDLRQELESAKGLAKTNEDLRVLNAVKVAGGIEKVLAGIQSHGRTEGRRIPGQRAEEQHESSMRARAKANLAKGNAQK